MVCVKKVNGWGVKLLFKKLVLWGVIFCEILVASRLIATAANISEKESWQVWTSRQSGYIIDFSRVGELLVSGTHRYSCKEIIQRGFIFGSTALSAYLGSSAYCTTFLDVSSISGATILGGMGFFLSHTLVIYPLIAKRLKMQQECQEHQRYILNDLRIFFERHPLFTSKRQKELTSQVQSFIEEVMKSECASSTKARSSQTWGIRKRLLRSIRESIDAMRRQSESENALLPLEKALSEGWQSLKEKMR